MRSLFRNPLFILGFALRIALIAYHVPSPVSEWYAPFLTVSVSVLTLDPWAHWLQSGGDIAAFPYGYAMWLMFLPLALVAKVASVPMAYAYAGTLLVADFLLLVVLMKNFAKRPVFLLSVYWLSPVIIVASYGMGFNDVLPALLLTTALTYLRHLKLTAAGLLLGMAISAKLSMVVSLPFFLIYFYNNAALKKEIKPFLVGLAAALVCLGIPFVVSQGALKTLISNPEIGKIYLLTLSAGNGVQIYLVPLLYAITLYLAWRVKRLNFNLFQAIVGLAFLLIVVLTPTSTGWFVWCVPFLIFYQASSDRIALTLVGVFSCLYIIEVTLLQYSGLLPSFLNTTLLQSHIQSLSHTALVVVGVIIGIRILRESIHRNDFFRLSRKPFIIGISGDSGAGKDTFSDSLAALFGTHSVSKLSGDDYHNWDRQKPMWQVMTHLNPLANDLPSFYGDLVALSDGKSIKTRHYDHGTGKMSRPVLKKSNDFILVSGLHALYSRSLRECYDLSVFLAMDESLRRHLKMKRDVIERGHAVEAVKASLDSRASDALRFIRPQAKYADLVFSVEPIDPLVLDDLEHRNKVRYRLSVKTRENLNTTALNRVLIGVCGLYVDTISADDGSESITTIEGDASEAEIALAAQMLVPRVLEFLDLRPKWESGVTGLMQLIVLSHINQKLNKRFV